MIVTLEKLKQTPDKELFVEGKVDLSQLKIEGVIFKDNADVKVKVMLVGDEVIVNGKYNVKTEMVCVRCLEKFEKNISGEFEQLYYDGSKTAEFEEESEEELFYSYEEMVREPYQNGKVDIENLVKECITVDIDGFPVCSENCKGPENFEEHNNSGIDPRWQQLINITKENR